MAVAAKAQRLARAGRLLLLGPLGDLAGELDSGLKRSRRRYALVVPPGGTVLRRLSIPPVSRRERAQALRLAAEASLSDQLDAYLVDYWRIDREHFGMAAVPRNLLSGYQAFAAETGRAATHIQVPELIVDLKDGLVLWLLTDAVMVCDWRAGVLTDWQVMPRANGSLALEHLLTRATTREVQRILLCVPDGRNSAWVQEVAGTCERALPGIALKLLHRPVTTTRTGIRALCAFDSFVKEQANRPASAARRRAAALSTLLVLAAIGCFLYLQLRDLESQAAHAEHTASLLKMQAARSSRVAERVRKLTAQVRAVRALNNNSVVALLDEVAALMPATVRLAGMLQIDRRGVLSLDGLAEKEQDIATFVGELNRHPQVRQVRLQSVTASRRAQDKEQGIRFRLRLRLDTPLWQSEPEEAS